MTLLDTPPFTLRPELARALAAAGELATLRPWLTGHPLPDHDTAGLATESKRLTVTPRGSLQWEISSGCASPVGVRAYARCHVTVEIRDVLHFAWVEVAATAATEGTSARFAAPRQWWAGIDMHRIADPGKPPTPAASAAFEHHVNGWVAGLRDELDAAVDILNGYFAEWQLREALAALITYPRFDRVLRSWGVAV